MAAADHLGLQFQYEQKDEGGKPFHRVSANVEGKVAGVMDWDSRHIQFVAVDEPFQRQGVATSLWNEGQRLASENSRVPAPKHSPDRTNAGDAWARSVGGKLPRRVN